MCSSARRACDASCIRNTTSKCGIRTRRRNVELRATAAAQLPDTVKQNASDSTIAYTQENTPTWSKLNKSFKMNLSEFEAENEETKANKIIAKGGGVEFVSEDNLITAIMIGHRNNSETFGAQAYLIKMPGDLCNVMIDCPKYSHELRDAIAAHGDVRYIVMTHTDDCAGHARWQRELSKMNKRDIPCERVMHALEIEHGWNRMEHRTLDMEIHLGAREGTPSWAKPATGPWLLPLNGYHDDRCQNPFIQLVFTPGHSSGSICINANNEFLFTGDTLCLTSRFKKLGWTNQYTRDYDMQIETIQSIISSIRHKWILPGHGRPFKHYSQETREIDIREAAASMANGDFNIEKKVKKPSVDTL